MDSELIDSASPQKTGIFKTFTLEEYLEELQNWKNIPSPSTTDTNDPLYNRKYAMSMPPLAAYRLKQPKWSLINVEGDDNRRQVFYGWNTITEHERKGI